SCLTVSSLIRGPLCTLTPRQGQPLRGMRHVLRQHCRPDYPACIGDGAPERNHATGANGVTQVRSMGVDLVGWMASAVLLATLLRQVHTQWKTRQTQGVSRWLFIGQVTASVGFTIYSWLLQNWVFLFANIAILMTAVAGEVVYLRNRKRHKRG